MRLLRDHGAGRREPEYAWLTGAMTAPCMHAGGWLASSQTTASWVSLLTASGARHWATGTAAACISLFKPVSVASPVDLGAPVDRDDGASLWWRHERLHRRVVRDPVALGSRFLPERDALEAEWLRDPPASPDAFAEGNARLAEWIARLPAGGEDHRPRHVRRYWDRRDRRAGLTPRIPSKERPHASNQ
jgi:secernin